MAVSSGLRWTIGVVTFVVVGAATWGIVRSTHPTPGEECGSRWSCRDGECITFESGATFARGRERGVCYRSCRGDAECVEGAECRNFAGATFCVPVAGLGDPCGIANHCTAGLCVRDPTQADGPADAPTGVCRAGCSPPSGRCRLDERCEPLAAGDWVLQGGGTFSGGACVPRR